MSDVKAADFGVSAISASSFARGIQDLIAAQDAPTESYLARQNAALLARVKALEDENDILRNKSAALDVIIEHRREVTELRERLQHTAQKKHEAEEQLTAQVNKLDEAVKVLATRVGLATLDKGGGAM